MQFFLKTPKQQTSQPERRLTQHGIFLFQGHDTTASGIFWTLYLLGRHPKALRKVQAEVDEVWGEFS